MLTRVRRRILDLDHNSPTFIEEATDRLVDSVIGQEFGVQIFEDPGYSKMQDAVKQKILEDPEYRERVTHFLELVVGAGPPPQPQGHFFDQLL